MRAVFSTYGSLGDVYPFLAIAQRLRLYGVTCVFITNIGNTDAVRQAGFEVHGIVTDVSELFERAGFDTDAKIEAARESVRVFWRVVMPEFSTHLEEVADIAGDASVIMGPSWAFNAQSVAEKKNIPFIGAHLWPIGFLNAYDPPLLGDLPGLVKQPTSKLAIMWNSLIISCAKQAMKLMFAKYLNPPREGYGLSKVSRPPVLDFQLKPARILGLYSHHFVPRVPDMPKDSELTGFPMLQSSVASPDPELDGFLEYEPVVFTLGSVLSKYPGTFYASSVAAAQSLGIKALVLTDDPSLVSKVPGVLVRGYVPHSRVFPHARIIVHHGGIGTTAQALHAGKPQLVVPHFGDQPDNGARLEKLGLARVLPSTEYSASSAALVLSEILASEKFGDHSASFKSKIEGETGAERAAKIILEVIADHDCPI